MITASIKEISIPSKILIRASFSIGHGRLYRNNLKNREFGKEAPQNFDAERATIAEGQGASEHQNSEAKPTEPKPDSSGYFGIYKVSLKLSFNLLAFLIKY